MSLNYDEKKNLSLPLGTSISLWSMDGGYRPSHWHDELEILFCLNGTATITIENEKYVLKKKQLIVIDSRKVHSIQAGNSLYMILNAYISRQTLMSYFPDIDLYAIDCTPNSIENEHSTQYLILCRLCEELVRLSIKQNSVSSVRSDGILLDITAILMEYFASKVIPDNSSVELKEAARLRETIAFVNTSFYEELSLNDMAERAGLSKEYFCRFFKKYTGISFLTYLNQVRISHACHELLTTDHSVSEIMENTGFTNQKLFNKTFKEIYDCTPSQMRKKPKENISVAENGMPLTSLNADINGI